MRFTPDRELEIISGATTPTLNVASDSDHIFFIADDDTLYRVPWQGQVVPEPYFHFPKLKESIQGISVTSHYIFVTCAHDIARLCKAGHLQTWLRNFNGKPMHLRATESRVYWLGRKHYLDEKPKLIDASPQTQACPWTVYERDGVSIAGLALVDEDLWWLEEDLRPRLAPLGRICKLAGGGRTE